MSNKRTVSSLLGESFIIPHYQRGYRWTKQEIEELLEDLHDYGIRGDKDTFYCLQPIVVLKNKDNSYDVLDGQQRLTTIFLILVYLEDRRLEDYPKSKNIYSLEYSTRPESQSFLGNHEFKKGIVDTYIDFFYISNAYQVIKEWFVGTAGAKNKILPVLMDEERPGSMTTQFIWYEVKDHENPIDIFIRLNVGKIPLTDAELIKALLLQKDAYDISNLETINMRLFKIAAEWDTIEYELQDEALWYFLSNSANKKPTHIELIFDLLADKINKKQKFFESKPKKNATFLILSKYLDNALERKNDTERIAIIEKLWQEVTYYFEYFKNWYADRQLYHYIGFIIADQGNTSVIEKLIQKSEELSKTNFKSYLKTLIFDIVSIENISVIEKEKERPILLSELMYDDDDPRKRQKSKIHSLLLLHNVITTLNKTAEMARFPFNLYKETKSNEKWSLEHIHALNSNIISNNENQINWLEDHKKSLLRLGLEENHPIILELNRLLAVKDFEQKEFDELKSKIEEYINKQSGFKLETKHGISNLCLLDQPTNSKLNNSIFDVKRKKIKDSELNGAYIPICSRYVFLKAFTPFPKDGGYWTEQDRIAYLSDIAAIYNSFKNNIKLTLVKNDL